MPTFQFEALCAEGKCSRSRAEMQSKYGFSAILRILTQRGKDHSGVCQFDDIDNAVDQADLMIEESDGRIRNIRVIPLDDDN